MALRHLNQNYGRLDVFSQELRTMVSRSPPCRADHSRKNSRSLTKTNHEWTRIDTKRDRPPSTTSGTKMLLQFRALGVAMSWDEGFLGARASCPRSQGNHSPLEGESQKPSRQAKADAVGGGRRATSQKADLHPLGNSRVPASRAPAPGPGGSLQSETTDFCGLSRARTLSGEAGWRQSILSIPSIN